MFFDGFITKLLLVHTFLTKKKKKIGNYVKYNAYNYQNSKTL